MMFNAPTTVDSCPPSLKAVMTVGAVTAALNALA
jgi:hypothetical protein